MHIFLTGGTGFVGSYFMQAALLAGHDDSFASPLTSKSQTYLSKKPSWCGLVKHYRF